MKYQYINRSLLVLFPFLFTACTFFYSTPENSQSDWEKKLASLELSSAGRIGISAFNTSNSKHIIFRSEERFPFCSTFKAILAAAVLKKSQVDSQWLNKNILFNQRIVESAGYAPITRAHFQNGMTVAELCVATIQHSDNAAANILLQELGGLEELNNFTRSIGDNSFRLDRWEPDLNSAIPGDSRDTTTPAAMERTLRSIVLGDVLDVSKRELIQNWLKGNKTGASRIRSGVEKGVIVGDKTGTGEFGTTNDVGVIWQANGDPITVVIFFTQKTKGASPREDIIAEATRIIVDAIIEK